MKRTVVVTGGTKRLGRVVAEGLRAADWRVITTSHRADAGADIVADLNEPMGAVKLYALALALNGGVPPDALVNNAALFAGDAAMLNRINFLAPQKLTMLMAGRETGRGSVVNILDCRVLNGGSGETPYAKSKRALRDYTLKSAAMFVDTLRVNAVAPGAVLAPTDVHEKAGDMPLGRPTPAAVVRAVVWLLDASFTSGCILPVDGGASLGI